jgi:hypothetical protein
MDNINEVLKIIQEHINVCLEKLSDIKKRMGKEELRIQDDVYKEECLKEEFIYWSGKCSALEEIKRVLQTH